MMCGKEKNEGHMSLKIEVGRLYIKRTYFT